MCGGEAYDPLHRLPDQCNGFVVFILLNQGCVAAYDVGQGIGRSRPGFVDGNFFK